ncbi:hypothetical protein ACFQ7A_04885 [Streptomyces sp. NPDC056528]|uniref:hypothetical protein n=1 Tax=Streptomyces sp. NPDC056528 TaxID=3345854 RepID=UPI0036AA5C4E
MKPVSAPVPAYETVPGPVPTIEPAVQVWLVVRDTDPGATPCDSESTARAYAEARYREDEDPEEPAVLRWDEDGELLDDTEYTGWRVYQERVLRAADVTTTDQEQPR